MKIESCRLICRAAPGLWLVPVAIFGLVVVPSLQAQHSGREEYVGGFGGVWTNANNWMDLPAGGPTAPQNNDTLYFPTTGSNTTDDYAALSILDMNFLGGANVININSGDDLNVLGRIVATQNSATATFQVSGTGTMLGLISNVSTDAQDAAVDVGNGATLDVSLTNRPQSVGALSGSQGKVLLGANTLTVGGLNTDTTLGATLSGAGGSITKVGTGTMQLTQASTYNGTTTIQSGAISILNDTALGTSAVNIGVSGGGNASLGLTANTGIVANNITVAAVASGSAATIDARTASPATINLTGTMTLNSNLSLMSAASLATPLTVSGQISGSGALNLNSTAPFADAVQLTNSSNNYTGGTNVNAGTLFVNNTSGSATGTNNVNVGSGATIAGNGTVGGILGVNSGATLAPGTNGIGTFHVGNGGLLLGGTLSLELGGLVAGSSYDQVQTAGGATIAGNLSIQIVNNFQPQSGQHFYILDNISSDPAQTTSGSFTNGGTVTDNRGNVYVIVFGDTDPNVSHLPGRDISLVAVSVIPEPKTYAFCFLGLGLLALRVRACRGAMS